jgi:hypothetical protein
MGLDMYAFSVRKENAVDEFTINQPEEAAEFFYWRKNNALHAWMQQCYTQKKLAKAQTPKEFNCEYLQLTKEDLINLRYDIKANSLTPTAGFFFGALVYDVDDKAGDLRFVDEALHFVEEGFCVYYSSWW